MCFPNDNDNDYAENVPLKILSAFPHLNWAQVEWQPRAKNTKNDAIHHSRWKQMFSLI